MKLSSPTAIARNIPRCLIAAACLAQRAGAADWTTYLSTNPTSTIYYWGDTATWGGNPVPDGVGAVANISADLSGTLAPGIRLSNPAAGTTAVNRTLGALTIGDTSSTTTTDGTPMTKFFGSFIFDNGGAGASITTSSGTFVQTPGVGPKSAVDVGAITINDNLSVMNNLGPASGTYNSTLSSLNIGGISETGTPRSVTFNSTGGVGNTAVLSASTYSGGTSVLGGRVAMAAGNVLGTGTVTVSSGAQVQLATTDTTVTNNFVLNGNGWAEQAGTRGALSIGANNTTTGRFHTFSGNISIASPSRIEAWSNVTANLTGALSGSAPLEVVGGVVKIANGSGYTGTLTGHTGRVDVTGSLGGNLAITGLGSLLGGKGTISGNVELAAVAGPPIGSTLVVDAAASGNLHAGGNLTLSGPTYVRLTSAPAGGTATIFTYGGTLSGGSNFDLEGGAASYRPGTGIDTATAGVVKLNYVTGTTTWNGGVAGAWQNFGTGWVGGDTFRPFDNVRFDNTVTPGAVAITGALSTGTVTVDVTTGTGYTLQGTGAGNLIATGALVKNGAGTLTMGSTTSTADNLHTFSGGVTLNDGVLRLNRSGATGNVGGPLGTGTTTLAGGAITAVGTSARSLTNPVVFNGSFAVSAAATDTGAITFNGGVNVAGDSTINVPGTAATALIGSSATSPALTGSAKLTKTGTGILRINSTSTYGGAISVNEGTLTIGNGATLTIASGGSITTAGGAIAAGNATSAIVYSSGATLSGVGTVGVNTTVNGLHSPGASPGTQTFTSGLTYSPTSTLAWELNDNATATRGTNFDAVDVTGGAFDLQAGATITLNFSGSVDFTNSFWDTNQSWLVVDLGASTTTDGGTNLFTLGTITGGGYSAAEGFFTVARVADGAAKNDVVLNWTAVPEPSAALLAFLGAGAFARRRRTA